MKRTLLYIALLVVVIVGVGYLAIWRPRHAAAPEAEGARTAVVQRGRLLVSVSGSGSVEPQARVNLTFESPGKIVEVPVAVGERVSAGDVLARLDDVQAALRVRQAQAALTSAQARLAQLQESPRQEEVASAEANLRAAEAQLNAAQANLAQLTGGASAAQIAAAEADLLAATKQRDDAKEAHDKTLTCITIELPYGQGEQELCPALGPPEEQTRYNWQAAERSLAAAQARYDELLAGADVNEVRAARANVAAAQAQRDAAQAQLDLLKAGPTEAQIATAEAQVAQAEVALREAQLALDKTVLRAPFDGLVAAVNVVEGEMAAGGLPAIVLLDASQYRVSILVDEMDVGQLEEGQTAEVTLDALPDLTLTGTVERVAPAATLEGGVVYYEVEIALDPTTAPIRADMTANATIIIEELNDVLLIPTWAVRVDKDTGQTYVQRRTAAGLERVDVEIGVQHDGLAEVRSGLSEGDVVVLVEEQGLGLR